MEKVAFEGENILKSVLKNPQEIVVNPEIRVPAPKIGTEEFITQLLIQLKTGNKVWRTAAALADKLGVVAVELEAWIHHNTEAPIVFKKGKEDGSFLYALKERAEEEQKTGVDKKNNSITITSNERLALGQAMLLSEGLDGIVSKYSRDIATRDQEAYRVLLEALKNLEFFVKLYSRATHYKKADS